MGRVRTKVRNAQGTLFLEILTNANGQFLSLDRQEVRQGRHRAVLSQTYPRLRDQQAHL